MTLRSTRRLTMSIGLLLVVQLLTSFGAVVLLGRMSPAIEKILRENVASGQAVELMAIALSTAPSDPEAPPRFWRALSRAEANITLPAEKAEITTLQRVGGDALAGNRGARQEAAGALTRLGRLNREAMEKADTAAKRLGTAGAWAVVFLGVLGMVISGATVRRLQRRVLGPIAEITRAIVDHRAGNRARRCGNVGATDELALVMDTLNELFDHRERSDDAAEHPAEASDRAVVIQLLDETAAPTLVLGPRGEVLAASRDAIDWLAGPEASRLRASITEALRGHQAPPVKAFRRVGDTDQWLCTLSTPAEHMEAGSSE